MIAGRERWACSTALEQQASDSAGCSPERKEEHTKGRARQGSRLSGLSCGNYNAVDGRRRGLPLGATLRAAHGDQCDFGRAVEAEGKADCAEAAVYIEL